MVQAFVYFFLLVSATAVVFSPWIPALFYFLNGIMQPSYVWPYEFPYFSFMSLSKMLAILSILGWMKLLVTKKIDISIYKNKQSFSILIMWGLMHISDILSPFQVYFAGVRAEIVLSTFNTIVIMYFIGLGILSNVDQYKKAFLGMAIMFAYITVYYVYWANDLYLNNRWDMFQNGRLISPRGTSIGDQNALSALIAMGMPFIFLGYFYIKNFFLKWSCLAVLPLLWHSLFLFGSRGAMLAIVCTTVLCLFLLKPYKQPKKAIASRFNNLNEHKSDIENTVTESNQALSLEEIKKNADLQIQKDNAKNRFKSLKLFKILIIIGLVGAIATQGGAMLNRSSNTLSEAQSADREKPLNPRLVSWQVGRQLILKYPILGAGPQRFQMASDRLFPGKSVHVAHNTFLNFSANTGLPVGLLFLFLFWLNYKNYKYCRTSGIEKYPLLEYVNIACTASLVAYFISAVFLDLIIFEAFYFILLFNLAKLFIFKKLQAQDTETIDKTEMKRHQNRNYF